jgi:hypothetical protein
MQKGLKKLFVALAALFLVCVPMLALAQVASPSPTPVASAIPQPVADWLSTTVLGLIAIVVVPVVAFVKTKVKIPGALVPVVSFILNAGLSFLASVTIAPGKFSVLTAIALTAVSTFIREVKVSVLGS